MTTPDIFGAGEGDYQLTCKTDALDPDIQIGDELVVRPQTTAEHGQIVVTMVEGDDEKSARLGRYWPQTQGRVIGLVIGLYRSVA
jgi:SOS-response transcriptional repressor LexA